MRKLRVAIVAALPNIPSGQSVQADQLLRAWKDDPEVDAWRVPVNWLPPRALRSVARVKYLRSLVMEMNYAPRLVHGLAGADVVHVFAAPYSVFLLVPLPAMLVAHALGRPVVLNYRNGEASDHLQRSPLARLAMRRVDHIAVPSRYLVDVLAQFGLRATPIANLVDLERFRYRRRVPLRPRILSTRNLHPIYRVDSTLRAFRLIQDRRPDASLTIVGGGSEEPALRALAGELRLSRVRFVGRVSHEEMARVYAEHDVYVQSPTIDNMPNSVIEAFASGLPVVATAVGGVPAMLTHGEHGLLAAPGDDAALAAHVLRLLDDPALARRLAQAAHATCEAYTWSAVRRGWLQAYSSVLAAPVRPTVRLAARPVA